MSSKGVDIKYKCPQKNNRKEKKSKCICQDKQIEVEEGALKCDGKETDYKYCRHWNATFEPLITSLNYGGKSLQIENDGGGQSRSFSTVHPEVWEVTTYYHKEYDNTRTTIKVPIILRLQSKASEYNNDHVTWYKNLGGNNLTWKKIPGGDSRFYDEYDRPKGDALEKQLKDLTCTLHNLHIVDIYKIKGYNCPCGTADVTVTEDRISVKGYTRYEYKYRTDKNSVRYKGVTLKDEEDQLIPLTLKDTPHLTVYYWGKDEERRKPLLMEVTVQGQNWPVAMKVIVSNLGEPDNSKWKMTLDQDDLEFKDGVPTLSQDKLQEKLQEQRCRLFRPVDIDVTKEGSYPNTYCKGEGCHGTVQVQDYHGYTYGLTDYTALKHTYGGNKTFTITGFTGEPKIHENKLPIWDVKELVVFFPKSEKESPRAINTHIFVYVESNDGKNKKWYTGISRNKGGIEWTEDNELQSRIKHEVTRLKTTMDSAKKSQTQPEDDSEDEEDTPDSIGSVNKTASEGESPASLKKSQGPPDPVCGKDSEKREAGPRPKAGEGHGRVAPSEVEAIVDLGKGLLETVGGIVGESVLLGLTGSALASVAGLGIISSLLQEEKKESEHKPPESQSIVQSGSEYPGAEPTAQDATNDGQGIDHQSEGPGSAASLSSSDQEETQTQLVAMTSVTDLGDYPASTPYIITSSVLTGVGVVSGSLTGFGWWVFKRSKGDPWVRHGYPIEFLKNVPW